MPRTRESKVELFRALEPFSLELAQRDLLGLFDENMRFDESSLAEALRDIASSILKAGLDMGEYNFLRSMADALDNDKAEWKLQLRGLKRGKFKTVYESALEAERDRWTDAAVQKLTSGGMKKEAAVALIGEQRGWSRSSIFKSLKRKREWDKVLQSFLEERAKARSTHNE